MKVLYKGLYISCCHQLFQHSQLMEASLWMFNSCPGCLASLGFSQGGDLCSSLHKGFSCIHHLQIYIFITNIISGFQQKTQMLLIAQPKGCEKMGSAGNFTGLTRQSSWSSETATSWLLRPSHQHREKNKCCID